MEKLNNIRKHQIPISSSQIRNSLSTKTNSYFKKSFGKSLQNVHVCSEFLRSYKNFICDIICIVLNFVLCMHTKIFYKMYTCKYIAGARNLFFDLWSISL